MIKLSVRHKIVKLVVAGLILAPAHYYHCKLTQILSTFTTVLMPHRWTHTSYQAIGKIV